MEIKHLKDLNINVREDGVITRYNGKKFFEFKPNICPKGYHRIQFMALGRRVTTSAHRLVAIAFIPNPENKTDVNHKDGNKNNNHVSNLEWATRKENMAHASKNGLMSTPKVKDQIYYMSKAIRLLLDVGWSKTQVALAFNTSESSITQIVRYNK